MIANILTSIISAIVGAALAFWRANYINEKQFKRNEKTRIIESKKKELIELVDLISEIQVPITEIRKNQYGSMYKHTNGPENKDKVNRRIELRNKAKYRLMHLGMNEAETVSKDIGWDEDVDKKINIFIWNKWKELDNDAN